MQTLFIGQNRIALADVDSTNDYSKTLLASSPPNEGTLITAEYQHAGRGQIGKWWLSERGANVTASLILYPTFLPIDRVFCLNMAVSVALRECCESLTGQEMRIKWPNDIYHEQAKVAGILIENVIQGTTLQSSIIGIGVNVNQQKFDHRLYNPTSLSLIVDKTLEIEQVIDAICDHIERYYLLLRQGNYEQIEQLYLNHLYRFQQTALFAHNGYLLSGSITGVRPDGRLIIHSNGKDHHFAPQEVSFVV